MSNNDQIILDQILTQQRELHAPSSTKSNFFEIYVVEQVLKDADLSIEEIGSGIVGDGGDGGIDGIYVFANGELVREDSDISNLKKNITLEVVIVQSKTSAGFDEDTLNRFVAVTNDLFDLSKNVNEFRSVYNEGVRSSVTKFRLAYKQLAARFPALRFRYIYASRGNSKEVHPNVSRKADVLKEHIKFLFSDAQFSFEFLGASDLLALARKQPVTTFNLQVDESISAQGGYIALVKLKHFAEFIRDERGGLTKNLFDANVRDYQGTTQVNEEIQQSLHTPGEENFWWLNNGVTVIASKAVQSGKIVTIEDPQIVNGLQTSTEIFKYFLTSTESDPDNRSVLVRIIVPEKAESSDRIIKATNSQTSIPAASLRATDKVHRDIEEYLKGFSIYYDRRKNMHKNEGRSSDQIIGIPLMAQAIMAICMQRPDDARARPSSLLKRDDDYLKIFSLNYPIKLYLIVAKLIKLIQFRLRSIETLQPKDKNNLLFYVAMHVAASSQKDARPSIEKISNICIDSLDPAQIDRSIDIVRSIYDALGATDIAAKGTGMLAKIRENLENDFFKPNAP